MIESVTLRNPQTGQEIIIDQYDSSFVLEKFDPGVVKSSHHSYKYVNQVGSYIESTTLEDRSPSISGWIIGDSYEELQNNKLVMNRLINPLNFLDAIIYEKYKLSFKPDYSVQYSATYKDNNDVLCKFLIQGSCEDPMFSSALEQGALIASTLPMFRFPWVIPKSKGALLGLRNPALYTNVYNQGDIDTGMVITFSCTASVTNPSLLNLVTGENLKINKILSPDERVIISTLPGKKYVKGYIKGDEYNYFKYKDINSTWLQLHPGDNLIKYDADNNPDSLEVSIAFYPRFLEVQ